MPTISTFCQVDRSDRLYKAIQEKDSLLFDIGFNTCNIEMLQNLISQEFTFFHDQSGITRSKDAFIKSVQNGLCKLPYKPIRILNQSSSTIYPLNSNHTIYGAIQNGEHSFYALEGNNQKYLTSTAKFTHVWIVENGVWKLRSVLSFNHKDVDKKNKSNGLFTDNEVTNNWLKQKNIPAIGIGFPLPFLLKAQGGSAGTFQCRPVENAFNSILHVIETYKIFERRETVFFSKLRNPLRRNLQGWTAIGRCLTSSRTDQTFYALFLSHASMQAFYFDDFTRKNFVSPFTVQLQTCAGPALVQF